MSMIPYSLVSWRFSARSIEHQVPEVTAERVGFDNKLIYIDLPYYLVNKPMGLLQIGEKMTGLGFYITAPFSPLYNMPMGLFAK